MTVYTPMSAPTPKDLANMLGRKRLAEALGVGLTAIGNACDRGKFPADWFLIVTSLCQADAIECPPDFFSMKQPKNPHDVD